MEVIMVALVAPLVVFPVVLVWYLNLRGIYTALMEGGRKLMANR